MKALVTGATGFVGSHLVDVLLKSGVEVTALARSQQKAAVLTGQGVRIIDGHLHIQAALERAVRDQDIVYHVAGAVAARSEADFLHANREGTRNMVAAAEAAGRRRFVLVSSLAAGGPTTRGSPLTGSEPPRPVTAYGRSKLEAEQVVRASRLSWSIVRPPVVYGPRDREVLKLFRLARLGIAPLFGDGAQQLSAVHATDLATALVAVGECPDAVGRTYIACHPEVFTTREFSRAIGRAMGRAVMPLRIPPPVGRGLLSVAELSARLTGRTTI
ncbi:MAG TPA: NAD-dependent epimerase/dehydratase family protein, partial [Gemmatimonadales bacterium]|nr:NAD-dependent epimerase/dehydratase family protein [Gemmatimonadales bacterium]